MSAPKVPMLDRAQWSHLNEKFEFVSSLATILGTEALPFMLTNDPAVHTARLHQYAQLVNLHASPAIVQAVQTTPATKPVKIAFGEYSGRENENLRRWLLEAEESNRAASYFDTHNQVANAILQLAGVARDCAFTCIDQAKQRNEEAFPTWATFKARLEASFHGEHARHNDRAKFIRTKQHRMSVFDYVQILRQLSAAVITEPLHETSKITVLREGLNVGPARTQLFRKSPTTVEEACQIALNDDTYQRRAHNTRAGPDMVRLPWMPATLREYDLHQAANSTELARQRQLSNVCCFNCNRRGHSRNCRRSRSHTRERTPHPSRQRRVRFQDTTANRPFRARSNSNQGNAELIRSDASG